MTPTPEELLTQRFGFQGFRPGQKAVMSALWRKKAALAVFPTGAGKSLCYQLPALMFEGVTLVVSPLIALMKDQIGFLQERAIPAARMDSSLSAEETRDAAERLRRGELKILYVAPERFNNERFLNLLKQTRIALFAVDEAHCISEWGHNFRPDYLKLAETARNVGAERVLALTATATPEVVREIRAVFGIPEECAIVTGFYRPNLQLMTTPVAAEERDALLVRRLKEREPGSTIVYVTLQRTAERVASDLASAGLPARPYHAGMEAEARTETQEWWAASDRAIVVATIAFGMGIDKADVRYVYHYNLPKSLESYSQEIGRAGRDDRPSIVEMLACQDDVPVLENFAYGDTPTESALRGLLEEVLTSGPAVVRAITSPNDLELDLYELSHRHDLRPLVLATALAYLELAGVLKQSTPQYTGYDVRPAASLQEMIAGFRGEPAQFLESVFGRAKRGRIWYSLKPSEIAESLGQDRARIIRAVEYLGDHGLAEIRPSGLRHRYTRLREVEDTAALTDELVRRFHRREGQEIGRIQQVIDLVTLDRCQTNALVRHFGEERAERCGHCTYCIVGSPLALPAGRSLPPLPAVLSAADLAELRAENPEALGESRQVARFLCGLSSPRTTRARLTRHAMFGALSDRLFGEVLTWLTTRGG